MIATHLQTPQSPQIASTPAKNTVEVYDFTEGQNPEDAHAKEVLRQTRIGLACSTGTGKASSG